MPGSKWGSLMNVSFPQLFPSLRIEVSRSLPKSTFFFLFYQSIFLIDVYNVVLVSGAQQSNSDIYIYIYIYIVLLRYFSIIGSKYYFYYFLRIQDHNNERVSKLHMEEIVHWQHSLLIRPFFF